MSTNIKERPILFSGEMVRGILDYRKTQTRRTRKLDKINENPDGYRFVGFTFENDSLVACFTDLETYDFIKIKCPYGKVGDRLWVRENFSVSDVYEGYQNEHVWDDFECPKARVKYACSGHKDVELTQDPSEGIFDLDQAKRAEKKKTVPSIHMPRWASRIDLQITSIRIEKLQSISEKDAKKEGVAPLFDEKTAKSKPEFNLNPMPWQNYLWHGHIGRTITDKQASQWDYQYSSYDNAKDSFHSLWQSINGADSWKKNPWVWVVEFERIAQ